MALWRYWPAAGDILLRLSPRLSRVSRRYADWRRDFTTRVKLQPALMSWERKLAQDFNQRGGTRKKKPADAPRHGHFPELRARIARRTSNRGMVRQFRQSVTSLQASQVHKLVWRCHQLSLCGKARFWHKSGRRSCCSPAGSRWRRVPEGSTLLTGLLLHITRCRML